MEIIYDFFRIIEILISLLIYRYLSIIVFPSYTENLSYFPSRARQEKRCQRLYLGR